MRPDPTHPADSADDPTLPRTGRQARRTKLPATVPPTRQVTRPPQPPATQRLGRLRVGTELGRGGMGVVCVAADDELRRDVAVKLLQDGTPDSVAQFVEEAQITGQLEHPNIVPVHDIGRDAAGRPWLAMKRIVGQTLAQRIEEWREARQPLDGERTSMLLDVFQRVCDALAFAHGRGVIHRDLKPDNIMLGEFGEVLVLDWGLARPLDESHRPRRQQASPVVRTARRDAGRDLTMAGEVFGTPAYMPPEQADGRVDQLDERGDVFALGAILYSMLTLERPYEGNTVNDVLRKAARRQLVPPRQRAPWRAIPRDLAAIVMRAMARLPDARYASVTDLQADVLAFRALRPVTARRASLPERLIKTSRRHPTLAASLTLSVVFVALAGVGVSLWMASEAEARAQAEQAERERQLGELRELAQRGEIDQLKRLLNVTVRRQRDAAADEFQQRMFRERRPGESDPEAVARIGRDDLTKYRAAFDRLFAAHAQYPEEVPITRLDHFHAGLIANYLGDHEAAMSAYRAAIAMDPDFAPAHVNLANELVVAGRPADAMTGYGHAIRLDPSQAMPWYNRGVLKRNTGDLDGALADFMAAVARRPDLVNPLVAAADIHMRRYQPALAIDLLRRAAAQAPERVGILLDLAAALRQTNDLPGAMQQCEAALRLDPGNALALIQRARVRLSAGDYERALQDTTAALELDDSVDDAYLVHGLAHKELGHGDQALAAFDAILQRTPDDFFARINRGRTYSMLGRHQTAIDDFTVALKLRADSADALSWRAESRMALQDFRGGLEDMDAALHLQPDNPGFLVNRARVHIALYDYASGGADARRALQLDASCWTARIYIAVELAQNGQRDDARQQLGAALRDAPENRRADVRDVTRQILGE